MASSLRLVLLLITVATLTSAQAQAPGPSPAGPANLTAILVKGGQFSYFQRLLNVTQVGNQIANQINTSSEGMTIFAPTDNAFQNLKPGLINDLSMQDQVQLVLGHVLPKFYSFEDFQTVSNPVRTQGSGPDGEQFGLEIVPFGNRQFNVSTGNVTTQVNNALRETKPLAVYQVDKVLIPPKELFSAKAPKSAPATPESPKSSDSKAGGGASADASAPSQGCGLKSFGVVVVAVVGFLTAAFVF